MPRRRKCAATTREAILAAARERFLEDSYDAVGLRDIARDAGVDVALVSRYFGTKEDLFKQVLRGGNDRKFELPERAADLPAFFVSLLAQDGDSERCHQRDKLAIMLRSAASTTASELIRKSFGKDVLEPLARAIGGEDAYRKAVLAMSFLIGTNFLNTVLPVAPLSPADQERLAGELERLLTSILAPEQQADGAEA